VSVALSLLVIGLILLGRSAPSQHDDLAGMTPLEINFASDVSLLGFRLPEDNIAPGETLSLTVYLQALRGDLPNYTLRVALVDAGQTLAEAQHIAADGWFSSEWPSDRYLRYDLRLDVPLGAEATSARIEVQLLGCETTAYIAACEAPFALLSFDSRGRPLGDSITLAPEISIR
jgi:hypothetical protein